VLLVLVRGALGETESVLGPPLAGRRPAVAGGVGLAGGFDPEVGVHKNIDGGGAGFLAEGAPGRIAPLVLRVRAEAVAGRVYDEVLAAYSGGDVLAVASALRDGAEVGDVEGETVGGGDAGLREREPRRPAGA